MSVISNNDQIQSKERISNHGEVFTASREVNAMLDLVKDETERIDSRFLEPACGTGNFLVEILRRKLSVVQNRHSNSQSEFERYSILSVCSIYGVDILADNVETCRHRLLEIFREFYLHNYPNNFKEECLRSAQVILKQNILWGDALDLKTPNEEGQPIVFTEWSAVNGNLLKRRDFTLAKLTENKPLDGLNLFSDLGDDVFIPTSIRDYPLINFLALGNEADQL